MSVRMGISMGAQIGGAARFREWLALCEDSALDSVWASDRLISREPSFEPVTTAAMVAGATKRIKFGFNALTLPLRDPVTLAKECATIDHLSGGRLLPVFGIGINKGPEWKATGRDPKGRGARANEALEIMARLWSEESVSYEGAHFQLREASISPRPVQQPLPIWVGGSSQAAIERTARLGTGWIGGLQPADRVGPVIDAIKRRASDLGRTIDPDHYGATVLVRLGSADDAALGPFAKQVKKLGLGSAESLVTVGCARDIIDRIRQLNDAGASKFVAVPMASDSDDVLLQTRRLIDEVVPEVHAIG